MVRCLCSKIPTEADTPFFLRQGKIVEKPGKEAPPSDKATRWLREDFAEMKK
jgi:hypothetical protein